MPTPVSILNRKVFVHGGDISWTSEPMNLQDYTKLILGLTGHGVAVEPINFVNLGFQHSASPETQNTANWATLTSNGNGTVSTGTVKFEVSGFLPWVRVTLTCFSGGGSGNLRACEVSLGGHAFETMH